MTSFVPSAVIGELLVDCGVFTDPLDQDVWPLYAGFMADTPDDCACFYDTQGVKDGRLMLTGANIFHYGLQLRVRAHSYPDGWEKIQEAAAALEATQHTFVSYETQTYRVDNVSAETPPFFLGHEEEGTQRRNLFIINYLATLQET